MSTASFYTKQQLEPDLSCYVQTEHAPLSGNCYFLAGTPSILIDAGLEIEEIQPDIVLITHGHFDHTQAIPYYVKKGAKIGMTAVDAQSCGITPELVLHDGSVVSNSNFTIRVIAVPGHTQGGVAFYEGKQGLLFSGDTWFGGDNIGCHSPQDRPKLIQSVQKLKALNPRLLCTGHGAQSF